MLRYFFITLTALLLTSCSVNSETTYYNDSASSMQTDILIDQSMLSVMAPALTNQPNYQKLTTKWQSLYDLQKDAKITLNKDSVKVLQKLFVRLNKDQGQVYGLSLKYDKLMPGEVAQLFSQSKQLKRLPLQNISTWNGKTLTLNTEALKADALMNTVRNIASEPAVGTPKTKSDSLEMYGREMAEGMLGMMKMFPVTISNTIKFQKPIKTISGKHDYIKQIDKRTIQISLRSTDALENKKQLTHSDPKIIIVTE